MKVIIYVYSLNRGGAEHVSVSLAEYLQNNNVECTIITETISPNEYEVPKNVKRISLDTQKNKYIKYLYNIFKLRKLLKNINADKLIIMDIPACLLAIPASLNLKTKVIVSERNDPNHFPGKKIIKQISRFLMKFSDGYVFQTEDAQKYYKNKIKNKGVIIPNPLFVEKLPNVYEGKKEKEIVTMGRLEPQKNHELLINAFCKVYKNYPEYKLIIYGEGSLRNKLEEQIKELNLADKVFLPGNKLDVLDRIKKSELFVLSSDYEGMPNALMEAMALGLVCISTDCPCGGPRYLIDNGKNGFLFNVGDEDELIKCLNVCIDNNEKNNIISKNAINIRDKFDVETISKMWHDYLIKI